MNYIVVRRLQYKQISIKGIPALIVDQLLRTRIFFFHFSFILCIFFVADLSLLISNILLYTQKPSPYRGLVYADLNHPTTSNTGQVKREFPTVYADIDYAKTHKASSKLAEEHSDQTTGYNDP